ncbi:MAG: LysM peptidoglycan-binding domain-containing protein [Ilumatobacter sp.]
MSITKASIDVEKSAEIGTAGKIECMFNPQELSIKKGATWKKVDVQGKGQPEMQFVSSTAGSFTLNLLFDTTDTGKSVTTHTDLLLRLIEPNKNLPTPAATTKRPPFVWFSWGHWKSFKAYVSSVEVTFTYFASDGTPLRAKANVAFMQPEEDEAWPLQNPTSHTPAPHRVHVVQSGESLDRIASHYLGDPTAWRTLAALNGITDPVRIQVGSLLKVPKRSAIDA